MHFKHAIAAIVTFFAASSLAAPDALVARQATCIPCLSALNVAGIAVTLPNTCPTGRTCTGGPAVPVSASLSLLGLSLPVGATTRTCS
ncbi:hypothetical protein BXZ70DRAFT_1012067 [Cristinia sonorae]|uniref:Hydrophobin n=1 Tax=Cristinia sonorae TaxID=1940300 RepID=A0A8K0XKQ7_9AGAR|nr:hypothetical protein BXZ70DRAFT_1012067 [Cristinia sonorae]